MGETIYHQVLECVSVAYASSVDEQNDKKLLLESPGLPISSLLLRLFYPGNNTTAQSSTLPA